MVTLVIFDGQVFEGQVEIYIVAIHTVLRDHL